MLVDEIEIIRTGLDNDAPIIVSDFNVLVSHEYPLLYTGKNAYGSWVIGSFLEEDEEDLTVLYYISFVLKRSDYVAFVSKGISYRNIFEMYSSAYIVKCDLITLVPEEIYLIDARKLEEEYFPHEQSYFPSSKNLSPLSAERRSSSLSYSVKLNGGIANEHLASLLDSIQVQQAMARLLADSIDNLPDLAVSAEVFQLASTLGSFKFNFAVDIKPNDATGHDLFFNKGLFAVYQNELIEYAIKYLPSEVNTVFYGDALPVHFLTLVEKTQELYRSLGKIVERQDLVDALKNCVHNAAENIVKASKAIGSSYDSIEFIALPTDDTGDESMGIITTDSRPALASAVEFIDRLFAVEEAVVDSETDIEAQPYRIRIYKLNTESRKGNGVMVDEDGNISKPKITISGESPLEQTKYTQSMDQKTMIDIVALGTRKNGKITKLVIEG